MEDSFRCSDNVRGQEWEGILWVAEMKLYTGKYRVRKSLRLNSLAKGDLSLYKGSEVAVGMTLSRSRHSCSLPEVIANTHEMSFNTLLSLT